MSASVNLTTLAGNGEVSLTWTVTGDVDFIEVYRDTDSNPAGRTRMATLGAAARSYTATGLSNGTAYWFWVKYRSVSDALTLNSNAASATPMAPASNSSVSTSSLASSAVSSSSNASVASSSVASSSSGANAQLLAQGLTHYQQLCAICHDDSTQPGFDGMGLYPIALARFATDAQLATYIETTMPQGNAAACNASCAKAVTAFMRNNYRDAGVSPGDDMAQPLSVESSLRKVKNLLTGLSPTTEEWALGGDDAKLKAMIYDWMETPEFEQKMLFFFANTFQQSSLTVDDFHSQLRNRPGAFNLSYGIYGDSAFPMLFKNMNESFARTALHFVNTGRPLSDLLTTDEFMMTTALKSLYMQIEANWDTASNANVMKWKFNYGRRPALADTLNPNHADYMVFGHEAPTTITAGRKFTDNCNGNSQLVSQFPGNVYLFHLMLGHVGRDTASNSPGQTNTGCWERATKPYFTPQDLSDWQMVRIVRGTRIEPWDLIKLRASGGTLPSVAPRISFFSTPAFFAVWNTNDSNAHRVTVNQALLAALGQGFTNAAQNIPVPPDTVAIDDVHAVDSSECFACHKSLDPMKQFFENWYFHSDKPKGNTGQGPQPSFGFGNVTGSGRTLVDFGNLMLQVSDERVPGDRINRFALEMTQKLCFFGNSSACDEGDPEMRRIAREFENSNFNFKRLVAELYSSPLITARAGTATFAKNGVTISITRRDQLCHALSNRLGIADICRIYLPMTADHSRIGLLAGALPADAFSRGVAEPVTSSDPNIFYRGASEMLCEAIAARVVDSAQDRVFSSSNIQEAINLMVSKVMAVLPGDPKHYRAVTILTAHYNAASNSGASATNALRSTFSAACQSPSSLGIGI